MFVSFVIKVIGNSGRNKMILKKKNGFNDVFRNKMINKSVFENPVSKQSSIYKNWNVWSLDRSVQKS